eukprot:CAMPEP_0115556286 /NCGR_PEP_ID=MMETSP0271-20121206/98280_1 /TAXON_ID=71861 /ORGANISM="Scrippsiella trochoidea, Strain CCMP3099" /LENGTH=99 /DNA_ID=CAMNT_0002990137 /DNA_START=315 /DNA_END=614 /DNA_ORIENTATION=+
MTGEAQGISNVMGWTQPQQPGMRGGAWSFAGCCTSGCKGTLTPAIAGQVCIIVCGAGCFFGHVPGWYGGNTYWACLESCDPPEDVDFAGGAAALDVARA